MLRKACSSGIAFYWPSEPMYSVYKCRGNICSKTGVRLPFSNLSGTNQAQLANQPVSQLARKPSRQKEEKSHLLFSSLFTYYVEAHRHHHHQYNNH